MIPFAFVPGDIYILGFLSIHEYKNISPYTCGRFRKNQSGFGTLFTFLHSIKNLAAVNGLRFGAIAIDDCYSPLRSSFIINEIFSGKFALIDPISNVAIDPSKIVAVIGSVSSDVTLATAEITTKLQLPHISFGASSVNLDDRTRYPYFLRTVPSDDVQVDLLLDLVKKFNFTHVGLLYLNDNYGKPAAQRFRNLAERNGICVGKTLEMPLQTEFKDIVANLTQSLVKVVVFLGTHSQSLNIVNYLSQTTRNEFVFIASESWGISNKTLSGNSQFNAARGSLVVQIDNRLGREDETLKAHLENVTYPYTGHIPWFRQFWEEHFKCNLPGGFDNQHMTQCPDGLKLDQNTIVEIVGNQRVVHIRNVVNAIGFGINNVLKSKSLSTLRTIPREIIAEIQDATVDVSGTKTRLFRDDGNGNVGFIVHNIQRSKNEPGVFQYIPVSVHKLSVHLGITLSIILIAFNIKSLLF